MPEDDEQDFEQQDENQDPNFRKALKTAQSNEKKLAQEKADLERELAFAKAGIPDTPLTTTLAKTYDGENDPASVRAYFEGLGVELTSSSAGVATHQTPPPPSGPSEEELAAQRRVSQLGSGGEMGGDVRFEDAIRSTDSEAQLLELIANAPEGALSGRPGEQRFRIGIPEIN